MSIEYAEKELSFTKFTMSLTKEPIRLQKYCLLIFAIWHFLYFLQEQ